MILELMPIIIIYLLLAWISHYENMMFGGGVIPEWLCIFCLIEKIKGDE